MKTIVIAQYRENIDWSIQAREDIDVCVVLKECDLPNVGREPLSFLWFICQNYDQLEGDYYFVQGYPFDHCPSFFKELDLPVMGFRWLGDGGYISDGVGAPHHNALPMKAIAQRLGFVDPDLHPYHFAAGGQFVVPAATIKARPLWFYFKSMYIMTELHYAPWCFERLWAKIFFEAIP